MVDLQALYQVSKRETGIHDILILMQLQNAYINQIYKVINMSYTDLFVASNIEFQEFTTHFNIFVQHQSSSAGFSKAVDALQVCHHALLEKLLDSQVVAAAEQLELAVAHLELILREPLARTNPKIILLNQSIGFLEETQLKIIETLEDLLCESRETQFVN